MSAQEKIAEKYLDEITSIAPIEVAMSFALGVCLLDAPLDSSIWIHWFGQNFKESWYFLDILLKQKVINLIIILATSLTGPAAIRFALKKLLKISANIITTETRKTFLKLQQTLRSGEQQQKAIQAAIDWRKMRGKKITRLLKVGSFLISISLITLGNLFHSKSWIDVIFSILFIATASFICWGAFKLYIASYLPERMLLDASLGLDNFKIELNDE